MVEAPFKMAAPETYNEVVVAFVEVRFTFCKFVMVDEAPVAMKEFVMAKAEVVALVLVAFTVTRFVIVDVELFTRIPAFRVWSAVQVFAFPRFKEATTFPVVGEMVNVPSAFETEVTAPERLRQVPSMA